MKYLMLQILFKQNYTVDIRCFVYAQLQGDISLQVIVNIIKFKRMHGLNYLSFGEQRLFLIILMILHVICMRILKETNTCMG